MARRILSEDTIANAIYSKFGEFKLCEHWHSYATVCSNEDETVEEYIISQEPELNAWLEMLIPYLPYAAVIDEVIYDYFRGEYHVYEVKASA